MSAPRTVVGVSGGVDSSVAAWLLVQAGEPVADLEVSYSELKGADFGGEIIVTMIDELPVLAVAARRGIGEPKPDRTRRYWNSVAVAVVRRPVPLLVASLLILGLLAAAATAMTISYDDRAGQPASTASNTGVDGRLGVVEDAEGMARRVGDEVWRESI